MDLILTMTLTCVLANASAVALTSGPDPEAVAKVLAGEPRTAYASWWGFDPNDATAALQAAIDSGAKKVIVEDMKTPWIICPVKLAGDQELVLEKGVVLLARRNEFRARNDSLLSASGRKNIRITGSGATLRMWRDDYARPPYEKAEWRHAIDIRSCTGVCITGLTIIESGGDGIYLGVSQKDVTNTDVEIRNVICDRNYRQGISVISAENLLIENTILRATAGTAPMAGIDFEPNHSSEELVNCVMRHCLVEGNTGDGFLFALHNLAHDSTPISIRIENCRSVGNRNGFRLNTGNGEPRTCVPGSVEVIDCRFEGSEQAGLAVSNKPAEGCRVRFERCHIVDAAQNQPQLAPILFSTSSSSTLNIGGVEFADCMIIDSQDRRPLGYSDRAGGLKLVQLGGTLTVERQGQRTAYPLDQKTLDVWFPFQAFKQFPPFNMAELRWEPTPPPSQPQPGWNCTVRQRGHGEFILWAEAGQEVAFTLGLKRVGKSGTPEMSVAVVTPSGEHSSLPKMTGEGEQPYTSQALQAGLYRIVCEPGNSTVQVVSSNLPIGLYSERAPFHLLGAAGDVYFCVPAGVQEFAIRISGAGEGESVKAAVYNPTGQKVGEKDSIDGHQFLLHCPTTADTETWRLQLVRPSQGVIEDYYVQLQGVPPILATHPEALPRPANSRVLASGPLPRLKVSENRRFLVTEEGRPFFWLGDTAWFIMRLTNDEIRYYLSNRVRKGFTGIQVDLNPYAWTNLVLAGETENPFLNDNPDTPNETYWQRVDWMVDEAGRSGLYVLLTPMWGKHYPRYVGNDTGKARRLGRWLGSRYRNTTHVMWFVSGEYDSINGYRAITSEQKTILNAVAQGLEEGHGGAQLMTIHPGARRTSSMDFHSEAWLDFNMLQSGHFDDLKAAGYLENHTLITNDYDHTPAKPVFDGEPAYEDMIDGYFKGPRDGSGSRMHADVMRRKAYWAVFAGGFGHTYGHTDVQIFWSPGKPRETANRNHWRDALEAPGAGQMGHLRSLIESRPFLNRVPSQSVIASAGGSGKDHVRATRASDGSYAMVYLPTGGAVTIDMSKISGAEAKASWFDPREGKATEIGEFPASGTHEFIPPSSGEDHDWVLVLDAADPENGFDERTIPLGGGAEWSVKNPSHEGNPFDLVARVTFRHVESGETRTTEMFYDGDHAWRFRFAGVRPGQWTFSTRCDGQDGTSNDPELHGLAGKLVVEQRPRGNGHGFIVSFGNKWGWQGTGEAFIPQYVMGKDLDCFYDFEKGRVKEAKIDAEIREFVVEHGFTGFHLQGRGRWFNLDGKVGENPNPDPRTYEVAETILRKVHLSGGACHIWLWGSDGSKDTEGPRDILGEPMSEADRRNLRYLAARLGPIPGWTMGYGYDTENCWAGPEELEAWKRFLEPRLGWDHFLGARVGFDENGPRRQYAKGTPKPPLNEKRNAPIGDPYTAWLGGDYLGYTSYRPLYDRYVEVLEHRPERPSFEEDRFRLRRVKQWTHKDYSPELTIKGLWHSAMAGGVANIWGNLLPDADEGGSQPYDHGDVRIKSRIKTYATFFRDKGRFRADFVRDNARADPRTGTTEKPDPAPISVCLRNVDHTLFVFYKEDTASVGMDLTGMQDELPAVAVDTQKAYREIKLGDLRPEKCTWKAPYQSDWAVAVGEFSKKAGR